MFKAPAPALRRSLSLYARVARSAARNGDANFQVERVRIRRPLLSRSRVAGALTLVAATLALNPSWSTDAPDSTPHNSQPDRQWTKVGPKDANNDHETDGSDEEEEEDTAPNDTINVLLAIPTSLPKARERVKYTPSDPEYQEYQALAKNPERIGRIIESLVMLVRDAHNNHPFFGQVNLKKGRQWIEAGVPPGPPLEYDQTAIVLTDNFELGIGSCLVTHQQYYHFKSHAWNYPVAGATAAWKDFKKRTTRLWTYMTTETESKGDANDPIHAMLKPLSLKSSAPTPSATIQTSVSPSEAAAASRDQSPANQSNADNPHSQSPVSSTTVQSLTAAPLRLMSKFLAATGSESFTEFWLNFKHARQDMDFDDPFEVPRGCLLLQGRIETVGTHGRIVERVIVCHHLKEDKMVMFKHKIEPGSIRRISQPTPA